MLYRFFRYQSSNLFIYVSRNTAVMTIGPVEAVKLKYHTRNTNKMRWVVKLMRMIVHTHTNELVILNIHTNMHAYSINKI